MAAILWARWICLSQFGGQDQLHLLFNRLRAGSTRTLGQLVGYWIKGRSRVISGQSEDHKVGFWVVVCAGGGQ
jgi:hypothetical protein